MKLIKPVFVLVVTIAVASIVLSAPKVFAQGYTGCDFCGGYTDYGDIGYTDYGNVGYTDYGNVGYTDYGSVGYTDYSYPGYTDYSTPGYTDYSYPGYTDYSTPGYTDYSTPGYTDYSTPGYTDYATYAQSPSYIGSSGATYYPSTGYSSYSTGGSYSVPSYSKSYPGVTFSAVPIGRPTGGTTSQTQSQGQDQNQSQNSENTNVLNNENQNVNYSPNTNTNVNNININIPEQKPQYQYVPVYYQQPSVQYPVQQQIMPSCTITITGANTYGSNQLATITWSALNASSASISPNVGPVSLSGSRAVYPTGQTVYTMTVYGYNGQTATCQTTAYLPPAPQVSLTQIPYTGLDFGTFGTAIYWASLIAFALAAAYLVVYFRGGAMALAPSMLGSTAKASKDAYAMPARTVIQSDDLAPAPVVKSFDLPVAVNQKMTVDSMSVALTDDGTPRIIINRN